MWIIKDSKNEIKIEAAKGLWVAESELEPGESVLGFAETLEEAEKYQEQEVEWLKFRIWAKSDDEWKDAAMWKRICDKYGWDFWDQLNTKVGLVKHDELETLIDEYLHQKCVWNLRDIIIIAEDFLRVYIRDAYEFWLYQKELNCTLTVLIRQIALYMGMQNSVHPESYK
jgi:hypothetical protein